MCAKKRNITSSDFLRYLNDELSNQERHDLERRLEADAFDREAMEGLESISPAKAEKDILSLHANLEKRLGRRKRIAWYSIAASVISILIVGTIFLNIYDLNPDDTASEDNTEESFHRFDKKKDKSNMAEDTDPGQAAERQSQEKTVSESTDNEDLPAEAPKADAQLAEEADIVSVEAEPQNQASKVKREKMVAPAPMAGSGTAKKTAMDGKVALPATDSHTTMAASFRELENDSELIMEPDTETLDEIVSVEHAGELNTSPSYKSAEPLQGFKKYQEYVKEHMKFPEEYAPGTHEVVVLSIRISSSGTITNTQILQTPGEAYSKEAIRLLEEGPAWIPASTESGPVDEEIHMQIVFKK